jgi:hypothetical protein
MNSARVPLLRFFLLATLTLTMLLSCSLSPSAGGSTDTETGGVVAGIVLDNNGKGAAEVSVTLIPASYNPLTDQSLNSLSTVITDEKGAYRFVADSFTNYNIYGIRSGDRRRFFHTGIVPDRNGTVRDTGRLASPGYLMVILPDTFDMSTGYFYFKGTPAFVELKDAVPYGAEYFSVQFDSLPSTTLPPLVYARNGTTGAGVEIAPSFQIVESGSLLFNVNNATVKPIWNFSLLVGIKDTICSYFGGISGIAPLITAQINAVTGAFTTEHHFDAAILFSADSFYEYSGTVDDEGPAALHRFNYRLLYDDVKQPSDQNDIVRFSYIYLSFSPFDTLFGKRYTGYLTKLFGELRGALNLSWLLVDSMKNGITNLAFSEIPSIMNNPLKYQEWDNYTISVINYNADCIGLERDILTTAFPDTTGVLVMTADGSRISGADVHIYGSALNSRTVSEERIPAGLTDSTGRYVFPRNLFMADSSKRLAYGNLLMVVTVSGDTASAWFPLYEAGNAYFADPEASFYKEIKFP